MPQSQCFAANGWVLSSKAKIDENPSRPKDNIRIVIFFSAISFFFGLHISHLTVLLRQSQTERQKTKGEEQHTNT